MRIVSIGLFAADFAISLANALAKSSSVTLFLSRQNLAAVHFPGSSDVGAELRKRHILDPTVSLRLINYPKGYYSKKVGIMRELVRAVQVLRPDVVHYQSGGTPWIALAMAWLRQYPLVATIHDPLTHPGGEPPQFQTLAVNFVVTRLAHQVIVHGRQSAHLLIQKYRTPPDRVNVVPLGPPEMFKTLADERIPADGRVVLFFGRLRAYKGVEVLIRAAPLIAASVPDVRFVIAGMGECPAVQRAAAENPNWFEVHNRFIEAAEVHRFFQRAALVVLPYLEASQSGVLPLAFLFGRPVVATTVGDIPEVLDDGKTGYLVEPGDEHALAEAIIHLLQDAALSEAMGQAGKVKLERELSWKGIAAKTLAVYERARACAS